VPNEELKSGQLLVEAGFDQGEAVDGGAVNGRQVGVVGLVTGVGRLAELFGGKGMDNAGLLAGGGEGLLGGSVVATRALDGDEEVTNVVLAQGLAELVEGGAEGGAGVFDDGRREKDVAIEVAEHPLGASLGTIDTDDAKVFRADLLDARMEGAARLLDDVQGARPAPFTGVCGRHRDCLQKRGEEYPNSLGWQSGWYSFSRKPTYQPPVRLRLEVVSRNGE
jgi:hypothetical protein